MSCYSDIPEDIISAILSHLCHDHFTLRACTITSSIFLFPSRRYLFSHVNVSAGSRQCRKLHGLLSSNSHLAVHVRHLTIQDSQEDNRSDLGWIMSEPTLPLVLGSLSLLRSFYLNCASPDDEGALVAWPTFPKDLKSSLLHLLQLPTLEKVEFRCLNIPLSLFVDSPHIRRLHLPGCFLDRSPQMAERPRPQNKMRLEQLSITAETYSNGLVDTLACIFDISRLRELIILGPNAEMLKAAGDLIKSSALSIERFQWSLPYFYNSTGHITSHIPIDLPVASNLRVLEMGVDFWYENSKRDPFPWLLRTLREMGTSSSVASLEKVVIGISAEGFGDYELRSMVEYKIWGDLDTVLTGNAYSKLENVTIYICALYTPDSLYTIWMAPMIKQLPLLGTKGSLRVTQYPFHHDMRGRGFSAEEIQLMS